MTLANHSLRAQFSELCRWFDSVKGGIDRKKDFALIAQSVEQRTENPCVGGSIPP